MIHYTTQCTDAQVFAFVMQHTLNFNQNGRLGLEWRTVSVWMDFTEI